MEVHKDPHHVTHKKKWTEYLVEFFMLFLAVLLGFIAENIRENVVERHREKEYIQSLTQDLKTDTGNLSKVINLYQDQIKKQDTLQLISDSIKYGYNRRFIELLNSIRGFPDFIYTDATIQELKSSGGFRLTRNKNVVDSINAYTFMLARTYLNTNDLAVLLHEIDNSLFQFMNFHTLQKAVKNGMTAGEMQASKLDIIFSHDKNDMDRFYNRIIQMQGVMNIIMIQNFIPFVCRVKD